MVSGPIICIMANSENVEVETNFLFLGSKIIADGDCSHEIEDNCFLPGSEVKW